MNPLCIHCWIPTGFLLDSSLIPNGFLLDSYWIPSGFPLDSCWIPSGFLMDLAVRIGTVRTSHSRGTNWYHENWPKTKKLPTQFPYPGRVGRSPQCTETLKYH